jgi:hypothetical protein
MDIAVIVSGDGDFAPAIRALQDVGIRSEVISIRPNTSSDLIAVADEFTDIMKIASIGRDKAAKGMSAPPMPAKEVDPDFAFREASPAVAAAALAAIKGGSTRGGRGRGRTTNGHRAEAGEARTEILEQPAMLTGGHHAALVAESPEHIEQHAENGHEDGNGEAHRRRRRRGGRGRGRRGHGEGGEQEAAVGAHDAGDEIGWQELDDISQLGDLTEERFYEFQEADPETLAELGLPVPEAAAPTTDPGVEPKPRARRTRAKAVEQAEEPASETPETDDVAPKPRRRSRAAATEAEATTEPAEKPARATRSRSAKVAPETTEADAEAPAPAKRASRGRAQKAPANAANDSAAATATAEDGAETQGIWQRFRSARTTRT